MKRSSKLRAGTPGVGSLKVRKVGDRSRPMKNEKFILIWLKQGILPTNSLHSGFFYCYYFHVWLKHQAEKDCWLLRRLFPGRYKTLIYFMGILSRKKATKWKNWVKARRMYKKEIFEKVNILLLLLIGCYHVWKVIQIFQDTERLYLKGQLANNSNPAFFLVSSLVVSFCDVLQEITVAPLCA